MNTIQVKYYPSLTERMRADSNHECKSDLITESNFPHDPSTIGIWEYKFVLPNTKLNTYISSDEVKTIYEKDAWQTAKIEHLLAIDNTLLDRQNEYTIVALGSVSKINSFKRVPASWYIKNQKRELSLSSLDSDFNEDCCFMMVRKIS